MKEIDQCLSLKGRAIKRDIFAGTKIKLWETLIFTVEWEKGIIKRVFQATVMISVKKKEGNYRIWLMGRIWGTDITTILIVDYNIDTGIGEIEKVVWAEVNRHPPIAA